MNIKLAQLMRWAARIVGVLLIGMFLVFGAADGLDPSQFDARSTPLMGMMLISLAGMAGLWKWELAGGATALGGIAFFYVLNYAYTGRLPGGPVIPLFFVPGFLAIAAAFLSRPRPAPAA